MTDLDRERSPSFINVSQVSAMKDLWHAFRKELTGLGKDEVEVGLLLSHANKEMLRFQEYLLRLGLDVDDIRNPRVVSLSTSMRPRTNEDARRIEQRIQFGITMLMQWWAINGVGTHAVWSDLGDEELSNFVSSYCGWDITLSRKESSLDELSMACSLWLLEGQDLEQASRTATAKKAVEIMLYAWELYWLQTCFRQARQGAADSQKGAMESFTGWAMANISRGGTAGASLRRSLGEGSSWDRLVHFVNELPTAALVAWNDRMPREPLRPTGEREMNLARRIAKSLEDAGDEPSIRPELVKRTTVLGEAAVSEQGAEDPMLEEFVRKETLRQHLNALPHWVEKAQFSEREMQVYDLDLETNRDTDAIAHAMGIEPATVRGLRKRYIDKLRQVADY